MYRILLEGVQIGGPVGLLCDALRQIEEMKRNQAHGVSDLEAMVGIKVDGLRLWVVDDWNNPIPAVKYKKEEK